MDVRVFERERHPTRSAAVARAVPWRLAHREASQPERQVLFPDPACAVEKQRTRECVDRVCADQRPARVLVTDEGVQAQGMFLGFNQSRGSWASGVPPSIGTRI